MDEFEKMRRESSIVMPIFDPEFSPGEERNEEALNPFKRFIPNEYFSRKELS